MGGGASKVSRIKKYLADIEASIATGDLESALDICLNAQAFCAKHSSLNYADILDKAKAEIKDALPALQTFLGIYVKTATDADNLMGKGKFAAARDLISGKLDSFSTDFEARFPHRAATWLQTWRGNDPPPSHGWSAHHPSLSVDGRSLLCRHSAEVGAAFVNSAIVSGRILCEVRI